MATSSRKEIRDRVVDVAKQLDSQKGSLVNELINLTLLEIQSPAWASESGEANHLWGFNRRTTTITTVSGTADYVVPRDVDKLSVLRQTSSDKTIKELTPSNFYDHVPDPANSADGHPEFYIVNSVQGVTTTIATAEALKIKSSSATDDGDTDLTVTIQGFVGGLIASESLTLDGTTFVNGTISFDAARPIFVSKTKNTVGDITIVGQTSGTTFLTLKPQDRNPLFKVVSFYPVPNAAITIYINYYTTLRPLNNDSDTPGFEEKWHHAPFWGTLAKAYLHLGKEVDYNFAFGVYKRVVLAMIQADKDNPNLVEVLRRHDPARLRRSGFLVKRTDDVIV